MGGALGDLLVVDLTSVRSGPTCTKILADFGAEVLRIERPGETDRGRVFFDHADLHRNKELHETDGPVKVLGLPVSVSRTPPSVRTPAPVPGAHTREVLEHLGYAADEIDALAAAGVVEVAK